MTDGRPTGPLSRLRRGTDRWASDHERARARAAERLAGPLADPEASWLEGHLSVCDDCRLAAEAYQADRMALRQLRELAPEPPRDLWARTAARIERESAARRPRGATSPGSLPAQGSARGAPGPVGSRPRRNWPAWGAVSGFAVVALVLVATALSGGLLGRVTPPGPGPSSSVAIASQSSFEPSAIAVAPGKVRWLGATSDGVFAYNAADIDVVCRHDDAPECPPLAGGNAKRVTLAATPKFVYQSPVDFQAVIVGTDASGSDAVLVVTLPTPDPTPSIDTASPTIEASAEASEAVAESSPTESGTPIGDVPSIAIESSPVESASIATSSSELPSLEPGSTDAIAIISGVTVVGRTASYSPDGSWFAFTARPADGTAGPDIYVWHAGERQARALTADHASVFSSWIGTNLVGSRLSPETSSQPSAESPASGLAGASLEVPPAADESAAASLEASASPEPVVGPVERTPEAFLMDPFTGTELGILETEWQPAVDPTRLAVVAWQGTVGLAGDGLTAGPASGNLVVHPFHGPLETDGPFDAPSASSSPSEPVTPSPSPSIEPSPDASGPLAVDFPQQVVVEGPIVDFDARWDDTGTWLAIWIADPLDQGLGRLSLLHFDPATGSLDRPTGAPQSVMALPGFSIGYGRLAWVSPPGQSGEGSRIQIAAWSGAEVGAIESVPVKDAIVVQ